MLVLFFPSLQLFVSHAPTPYAGGAQQWRITYQTPDDHSQLDISAGARSTEQGA